MKKKPVKGEYGYLPYAKKRSVIVTTVMLGMALAVYILGLVSTGSNQNLLTIVAVLGCLPGCKSAVNMIMLLRTKSCGGEIHRKISEKCKKGLSMYNMEFTSYEATFEMAHMAMMGSELIGYTVNPKCVPAKCEKHLKEILKQNAMQDIHVKIFDDFNKYMNRLEQFQELEEAPNQEQAAALLTAISL